MFCAGHRRFAAILPSVLRADYLKIKGIKPRSDGPPNAFQCAEDTNIPALAAYVHTTTSKRRVAATTNMLKRTTDFLQQVELYASASGDMAAVSSADCETIFAKQLEVLHKQLNICTGQMSTNIKRRVENQLKPSMQSGAEKGKISAQSTVQSWESKDRRTKQDRNGGGLWYGTYFATVRRGGSYQSPSAGAVDFNQGKAHVITFLAAAACDCHTNLTLLLRVDRG